MLFFPHRKIRDNSSELEVNFHFFSLSLLLFASHILIIVICSLWITKKSLSDSIIVSHFPLFLTAFLPIPLHRVGETGAWDEIAEIHTNGSRTTYVVTNLLPFTVYSFRILAVNRLGMSLPSKESYYICTLREGEFCFREMKVLEVGVKTKSPSISHVHHQVFGFMLLAVFRQSRK